MPEVPPLDENTVDVPDGHRGRFLHYRVINRIGAGGMGQVYLAHDEKLDRLVALKTLSADMSSSAEFRQRLRAEARASARLTHQNICSIYAIEETDNELFISMEYVQGVTLKDLIGTGLIDLKRVRDIAKQCCGGLAAAHEENLIHRDIKPANIMIDKHGTVKILDFGLAKAITVGSATETAGIAGTYQYMSPEQITGRPLDHRTDLFSLGVVLYELLTGHLPFKGDNVAATAYAIVHENPVSISEYNPEATPELESVVMRALSKEIGLRYQSAQEMRHDLGATESAGVIADVLPSLAKASIAVFPFENLGNNPENEFLSEGICDDVVTAAAKIPQLSVASLTAVRRLLKREMDPVEISRKLNVRHFLEGSLRVHGETLRLNAQLTRADDGFVVWSDTYERTIDDLFSLQTDIAFRVASALNVTLAGPDVAARPEQHSANPAAYESYLKGKFHLKQRNEQSLIKAVEALKKATRLDSSFGAAYGQFAIACALCDVYGYACNSEVKGRAKEFARTAIELDPGSSEAHISMFFALRWSDIRRGISELRTATALDGSNSEAHHYLAHSLMFCGYYKGAQRAELVANRLDPFMEMSDALLYRIYFLTGQHAKLRQLDEAMQRKYSQSHVLHSSRGWLDWCSRRWASAAENYEKALSGDPSDIILTDHLADCYIRLGRHQDAIQLLRSCLSRGKSSWMLIARLGQAHLVTGDAENAETEFADAEDLIHSKASLTGGLDSAHRYFQVAWLSALKRDRNGVMSNLRAAVKRDYGHYAELRARPDWDAVRGDEEFERLVSNLEGQKKREEADI